MGVDTEFEFREKSGFRELSKEIIDKYGALPEGANRVIRGGSWNNDARYCRSAYRIYDSLPGNHWDFVGFRVCLQYGKIEV